ncbi:MAG: hypothetical protein GX410_06110 [Elusimicrobia bacterium]|nr:hypothetical protein [Elusimicrobiota bacterium]
MPGISKRFRFGRGLLAAALGIFLAAGTALHARAEGTEKLSEIEVELDPYYASAGWYRTLSSKPIENMGKKTEWEIYRQLLSKFYPRTVVFELSVNPLPCLGTYIKKQAPKLYNKLNTYHDLNLVESVTAGFEEPWAASLFLGNVLEFESVNKAYMGKRHGYAGFLFSVGNFHIKQNEMIHDDWLESEVKLKGEQLLKDRALRWSFRVGLKHHGNPYIEDSIYAGIRRSRTDFSGTDNFFINNTGIEYVLDLSRSRLEPLRQLFLVEKKFPLEHKRFAFSLGLGFVWTSSKKYTGPLADIGRPGTNTELLIRPNIEF